MKSIDRFITQSQGKATIFIIVKFLKVKSEIKSISSEQRRKNVR